MPEDSHKTKNTDAVAENLVILLFCMRVAENLINLRACPPSRGQCWQRRLWKKGAEGLENFRDEHETKKKGDTRQ